METIKFGLIGSGMMGKEFAAVSARWAQLIPDIPRPEIVALCDTNLAAMDWFRNRVPEIKQFTQDYHELLANDEVQAVYCAVPHNMHKQIYVDIIRSGKHFLGEKPFGMDKEANDAILEAVREHPESLIRCASEFPYYPGAQMLIRWIQEKRFGKIMEVHAGFNHSSDLDPAKKINWKRDIKVNGEYGCMGDLGIHAEHIPFRMGWIPKDVYALLGNYITEREAVDGEHIACETWDNATLICTVEDVAGDTFPMFIEMKRMMPGATNDWFLEVYGLECSAKYTTSDPNAFYYTQNCGSEQAWCRIVIGTKPLFPVTNSGIFEFGFTDSMLQMWAAFMSELAGMDCSFHCVTPEETALSHKLQTAALASKKSHAVVNV